MIRKHFNKKFAHQLYTNIYILLQQLILLILNSMAALLDFSILSEFFRHDIYSTLEISKQGRININNISINNNQNNYCLIYLSITWLPE